MVRNQAGDWNEWASKLSDDVSDALKPMLSKYQQAGYSLESILYVVSTTVHTDLLYLLRQQHRNSNTETATIKEANNEFKEM